MVPYSRVVDPDPYLESGSGSRGKKTKKFQWKKCTLVFKKKFTNEKLRYEIALTTGTLKKKI
jgi:hypothetical protein